MYSIILTGRYHPTVIMLELLDEVVIIEVIDAPCYCYKIPFIIRYQLIYTESKKLGHFFTAYNFRNIEQIFTQLGMNHVLFMLNIMP